MGLPKFLGWVKKIPKIFDTATESEALKDAFPAVRTIDAAKDVAKAIFNDDLAKEMKSWPAERINAWFVRLGKAFGPAGLTHFSELTPPQQDEILAKLPILRRTHDDWAKPFQWMPRKFTAWFGPAPTMADVIEGNVTELKPIPKNGEWYILRGYMTATTEDGVHDRLGWRYDDVDDYYDFSITLKRVN